MEWGARDVESDEFKQEVAIAFKTSHQIKLYQQSGLSLDEAVDRVCSEFTPEEVRVYERIFERIRSEVERIRRGEPPKPR